MPQPATPPRGLRGAHPRTSRFQVSPISHFAPPVRTGHRSRSRLTLLPRYRLSPYGDAHERWTPSSISAPVRTVPIMAGWIWQCPRQRSSHGGRWRQLQCVVCGTYFLETHGTPLQASARTRADGVGRERLGRRAGIRAVARVFAVDPNTVLDGWSRPPTTSRSFPAISSTTCTSLRCNSMSCLPCSALSRRRGQRG